MVKAKNGAELLVQCLEAQGVKYIFGIPGAKVDVLADHGTQLILCRHVRPLSKFRSQQDELSWTRCARLSMATCNRCRLCWKKWIGFWRGAPKSSRSVRRGEIL